MDTTEKLRQRAIHLGQIATQLYVGLAERALVETESPIEAMVYFQLYLFQRETINGFPVVMKPQVNIDRYRVDFLVTCGDRKVVVECDGHAFHEKTKQQAAHDKKRDRELSLLGYQVLRYTGSEIYDHVTQITYDLRLVFDDELREFDQNYHEQFRRLKERGE